MPDDAHLKTFYLTTPIYYVNARPHIGHAYSTIVADVLARRHRLLGDDVFFLTGTDEHGQKIERSAAAAGVPPQEFADRVSKTFSDLWKRMGITNDDFIRTTEPRHVRGVQELFTTLYERGHIYLSTYTGQYSIGEEMFVDGPPGTIGPDGRPTETVTEENFFFRLSAFQGALIDLIEGDHPPLKITPHTSRNEVLSFVRGSVGVTMAPFLHPMMNEAEVEVAEQVALESGIIAKSAAGEFYVPGALKDLSVSRSSFTWGIPVPEAVQREAGAAQKHVVYVWLDALANYMTAVGYGDDSKRAEFATWWPADLHLVGKEITRFHCVYWPAFLLAAGLPLPKQVTANGWLLFDNAKMSKSKGNVVRTETILDGFGDHVYGKQFPDSSKEERDLFASDVLRYYLLREIPFGQDGSFSFESMWARYDSELGSKFGNLVSRCLSMIVKYFDGVVPTPPMEQKLWAVFPDTEAEAHTGFLLGTNDAGNIIRLTRRFFDESVANCDFEFALLCCFSNAATVDKYIADRAPWKLTGQDDREALAEILYTAAESIRIIAAHLYAFLPAATAKVWRQLGLGSIEEAVLNGELKNLEWGGLKPGTKLGALTPIFPVRKSRSWVFLRSSNQHRKINRR